MLYLKDTFKYVFRNFFKLIWFTIIPAVLIAIVGNTDGVLTFFADFETNSLELGNIYRHFSLVARDNVWLGILSVIVACFFLSVMYSVVERHLKLGKFSFNKLLSRLNETLLTVCPYYIIMVAAIELFGFLVSVFIFVFYGAIGLWAIIPSILLVIFFYFALCVIIAQFVWFIPSQIMLGYPAVDSCINATKLISGKSLYVALDIFILCVPVFTVGGLLSVLLPEVIIVKTVYDVIICNLALMLVCAYPMVSYFKISGEPRRDLEKEKKYIV